MHYALRENRYPIETKEQVKSAEAYFTSYLNRFSPSDRVEAATNLEKRAEELNISTNEPWIVNYSRMMKKCASYSPEFEYQMKLRKNMCTTYKTEVDVGGNMVKAAELVDKLVTEKTTTEPLQMVVALGQLDKVARLESHYDTRIMDPVFTVFGSMKDPEYDLEKVGECSVKSIKKASKNKKFMTKISSIMGADFAKDFQSSPVDIFKSLPHPEQQLMIEKIAEIVYQCEECGHKVEVGEEEEPEACPLCGGKMELAEVDQ